ncbi:MAG TPA: hypothetical protein VH518_16575 [Tepidisphaeraceae bacterium]|jgi:hypothetical protein
MVLATTLRPILAEDWGPLIMILTLVPLGLGVLTFVSVALNKSVGRRRSWGLVLALIPTLGGGLLLFMFLTVRGGAPIAFHLIAAFPFLGGLWSIFLWSRAPEA